MNHAGEILLAGQQNCSGGQGFSLFNVFIAPFFKGLDYKEIKQNIQMLVYNLNMAYSNRGGQVPFTSINLEFTVPDFIKDEIAWGPKGEPVGVYGDYEKEVRLLSNAFAEVLREGDAMGKPHLFPNTIWVLREEMMTEEFDDALELVHEVSAKYSTPYFVSCIPEWTGGHSNVMGCRTRLNTNWTGNWDTDTLRTGNLAYITINFPRIAYKSNGNFKDFFDELERVLKLAKDILLIRRHHALKLLNEYNMLPFLAQKNKEGEKYYRIENATLSFGIIGMDEMAKAFHNDLGKGIESKEGSGFIATVLAYINEVVKSLQEETGLRWTVLQTPGETTAHRFATLDKKHFPEQSIANGEEGAYYYTNSTHVPVDSKLLLPEKIKIESQFHPFTAGGHIFHVWLGESPNAKALLSLTKKIATRSQIGFWAYTGAFSFCFGCNTFIKGIQTECHSCGEEQFIEHYSRITGYMQQVGYKMDATGGWNPGKRQELKDRYEHEL
jgi:ribonucleoside-triphosphate reductase